MENVAVHLVKAFAQDPEEGNPAGVVLDADHLSDAQMQGIAQELGFSESAFLSRSDADTDARIRFFSPTQEVDFCAHATLAAVRALLGSGMIQGKEFVRLQANAKTIPVEIAPDGRLTMTQSEPFFSPIEVHASEIASLIGITMSVITGRLQIVSTGTPKLIIPVKSVETLSNLRPDLEKITRYCEESGARGFYVFTPHPTERNHYIARQFNPWAGIDEDPVTGIAAGALGGYFIKVLNQPGSEFTIAQGANLGKPGLIYVDTRNGIKVGGYAVGFGQKQV